MRFRWKGTYTTILMPDAVGWNERRRSTFENLRFGVSPRKTPGGHVFCLVSILFGKRARRKDKL